MNEVRILNENVTIRDGDVEISHSYYFDYEPEYGNGKYTVVVGDSYKSLRDKFYIVFYHLTEKDLENLKGNSDKI